MPQLSAELASAIGGDRWGTDACAKKPANPVQHRIARRHPVSKKFRFNDNFFAATPAPAATAARRPRARPSAIPGPPAIPRRWEISMTAGG